MSYCTLQFQILKSFIEQQYQYMETVKKTPGVQESSGDIENPENENNNDIDEIIAQAHLNVPLLRKWR